MENKNVCAIVSLILVLQSHEVWLITSRQAKVANELNLNNEDNANSTAREARSCLCMEYWNCAARQGEPYAYCGISETEVCCFLEDDKLAKLQLTNSPGTQVNATASPPLQTSEEILCGKQKIEANLDNSAQFLEWPWHAAILENEDDLYICGGSLISRNRVMTAAHCVSSYTKQSPRLKVRLGEYDVSTNGERFPHVEVMVSMIAIHPEFNNATLENDIAILGLSRDVNFTFNIQPICLPPPDNPKPVSVSSIRRCVVTGWGRRREDSPHSIVLKEVIVPIWGSDDCQNKLKSSFGPNFVLHPSAICAGDEKRDACDGDGGGPLVCFSGDRWVQEGIVSFGIGCGRRETPGIYTKVSWFSSWVEAFVYSGVSNSSTPS